MKKLWILACLFALGCASNVVEKHFTLVVDPPDARIAVVGADQTEKTYSSPADITIAIPKDAPEAGQGKLVISRKNYKTLAINVNRITDKAVMLKLEKSLHYGLKFRLVSPIASDNLVFRDKVLSIRLVPGERQFHVEIENLSGKPLTLLWNKSEYRDYWDEAHAIMPADVKPQDRMKAQPPETVPARGKLVKDFMPVDFITYSQKNGYESKPLFPLFSENAPGLKGKMFSVFLLVEMDRAMIPDYNFRFMITDVVKE